MNRMIPLAIPLAITVLLTGGCAATQQAERSLASNQELVSQSFQGAQVKSSSVAAATANTHTTANFMRVNQNWVNTVPLAADARAVALPEIFQRRVIITMPGTISAVEVLSELQRASGLRIHIAQDIHNTSGEMAMLITGDEEPSPPGGSPVTISDFVFNGTLREALDLLAVKANIYWEWNGSQINAFRFITRTYNISALAGTTRVNSNVELTGAAAGGGGGEGEVAEGAAAAGITREANLTVWDEVTRFILGQLSSRGRFAVLETSGIVTITDVPSVHAKIAKSINELNALMTQQVHLNINVFSLTQNTNDNIGIDWDLVWGGSNRANFGFNSISPPISGAGNFSVGVLTGPFAGTNVMLNALSSVGRVSLIDQYSVTTLNGQPAPIAANKRIGFLERVTVTPGEDGDPPIVELTPGQIVTGINMNVIPKVEPNGQIILEYVMNLNDLLDIRTFAAAGGSAVELPTTSSKTISNRAVLRNGQTLVLSGFKKQRVNAERSGVGSPNNLLFGGGRSAGVENQYLIITVTPYVAQNRSVVRR